MRDILRTETYRWFCPECDESFVSNSRFHVHRSAWHPTATKLDRVIKTTKVKGMWNEEKDWNLARAMWKDNEICVL